MPWYKTGTVSVTQNSNAVIGSGTAFIANSRVGDAFRGPDGGWYEVTNIASDTAISISPNYQGATNAAGVYALAPIQGYVKESADALRSLVNQYGAKLAELGTTGNYEILPPSKGGTGITDLSVFIQGMLNDADAPAARATLIAAKSGVNSDITELSSLTKPITAGQGGVGQAYIEGLAPRWLSSTSLGVDSGAAFVPGSQKTLVATAPITKSGLGEQRPTSGTTCTFLTMAAFQTLRFPLRHQRLRTWVKPGQRQETHLDDSCSRRVAGRLDFALSCSRTTRRCMSTWPRSTWHSPTGRRQAPRMLTVQLTFHRQLSVAF